MVDFRPLAVGQVVAPTLDRGPARVVARHVVVFEHLDAEGAILRGGEFLPLVVAINQLFAAVDFGKLFAVGCALPRIRANPMHALPAAPLPPPPPPPPRPP